MTQLSVNINKIATITEKLPWGECSRPTQSSGRLTKLWCSRHHHSPQAGSTPHRYDDAMALPAVLTTEFNIEGNPIPKFIDLVLQIQPDQVTLVPDAEDAITSNAGWDTIKYKDFLVEVISEFKSHRIRTSIFVDPIEKMVEGAKNTGTDRIELYTEAYAQNFKKNPEKAVAPYTQAAIVANDLGIGINAGHDLNLENTAFFAQKIPNLLEVSIGHALVSESLYLGFENVIPMYLQRLS